MNRFTKKLLVLSILIFSFYGSLFAQDAVTRALDLINKSLILNDYDRAYNYAKFVANYYDGEEIPADVLATVNNAMTQRADHLIQQGNYDEVLRMEEELRDYPENIQHSLDFALIKTKEHVKQAEEERNKQIEAERKALEEKQKAAAEAAAKAEREAEAKKLQEYYAEQRKIELEKAELEKKIQAEQEAKEKQAQQAREDRLRKEALDREEKQRKETLELQMKQRQEDLELQISRYEQQRLAEEQQLELERKRQEADEEYRQQMSHMLSEMNENTNATIMKVSKNNKSMIYIILLIVIIFIFLIIFVVLVSIKQLKNHQDQMKDTLLIMQAQSIKNSNSLNETLPLLLQMQTLSLTAAGGLGNHNSALALEDKSPNQNDDKSELTSLIADCKKYGKQIDEASGRKNVSIRVADLVLKISQQLGYTEYDCILYYAAALVYDIGLLNIDTGILKSGSLTEAQFKQVQTHTVMGKKMLFFVNDKYRPVFADAVSKHHENLDGTGYPNGLKEEEIPYIARVLRVAESYIALISNRSYKEIRDGDSAIAELRNLPNHYDESIVDALDAIL